MKSHSKPAITKTQRKQRASTRAVRRDTTYRNLDDDMFLCDGSCDMCFPCEDIENVYTTHPRYFDDDDPDTHQRYWSDWKYREED